MMNAHESRISRFPILRVLAASLFLTGSFLCTPVAGAEAEGIPDGGASVGIESGKVFDWLEFGAHFKFDDHVSVVTDIEVLWSQSFLTPPRAYFYAAEFPVAEVALAPGVQHVSEVSDASALIYEIIWGAGPVDVGEFVFFRNPTTGFYGAMRFDWAYDSGGPQALADVTWYLQQDGTADFSAFVFFDGFESGDTAFWTSPGP